MTSSQTAAIASKVAIRRSATRPVDPGPATRATIHRICSTVGSTVPERLLGSIEITGQVVAVQ